MADKLTLPKSKFDLELTAAPIEPTMKAAEATTGKLFRVPVGKIKVIPGFNLRVETPDYIAHRDGIRDSIEANGFNQKKPLSGYVGVEDGENVIYVTDGHTRLSAVKAFNKNAEDSDKITTLPVLVAPKETVLADLLVELHTANNGRELTPFEKGILAKRLLGEGLKKPDIAKRLGFTPRYLDDVLLLANSDSKVKQHVASGSVSSTMAIQLLRADADTAAEKIESAVSKTTGTGKKATKKHAAPKTTKTKLAHSFDAGDDMKEIVKAVAALIRSTVTAEDGEEDVKLSVTGGTVNLVIELPAAEKAKPAKKATAKKAPAKKPKAEPAAEGEGETKPAKKAAAKKAPAKKPKAPAPVEGAEEIDDEDGEEAILPPKVESDEDVTEEDDVDI